MRTGPGGPHFVLTGAFGWGIVGDEAILENTVRVLVDAYPDASITALCDSGLRLDRRLPVRFVPSLAGCLHLPRAGLGLPQDSRLKSHLRSLRLSWLKRWPGRLFADYSRTEAATAIRGADALILCGGGYLNGYFESLTLSRCLEAALAAEAGVPILLSGATIGPGPRPPVLRHLQDALDACVWAGLRDGAAPPCPLRRAHAVPDDAFSLPPAQETARHLLARAGADDRKPRIGVFYHVWPFVRDNGAILALLSSALAEVSARTKARLVLLPMRFGKDPADPQDDRLGLRALARSLSLPSERLTVFSENASPREMKAMAALMDLNIATRYHGAVFSLAAGIHCVGLHADGYYALKMSSLLGRAGLPGNSLPLTGSRAPDLASGILAAWARRSDPLPEAARLREDCLKGLRMEMQKLV